MSDASGHLWTHKHLLEQTLLRTTCICKTVSLSPPPTTPQQAEGPSSSGTTAGDVLVYKPSKFVKASEESKPVIHSTTSVSKKPQVSLWSGSQVSPWSDSQVSPWSGSQVSQWSGSQVNLWSGSQVSQWSGSHVSQWSGSQVSLWSGSTWNMYMYV